MSTRPHTGPTGSPSTRKDPSFPLGGPPQASGFDSTEHGGAPQLPDWSDVIDPRVLEDTIDKIMAAGGPVALTGRGGFLPGLVKAVLERGLDAELTGHLGYVASV
jgi:hypothetical protein